MSNNRCLCSFVAMHHSPWLHHLTKRRQVMCGRTPRVPTWTTGSFGTSWSHQRRGNCSTFSTTQSQRPHSLSHTMTLIHSHLHPLLLPRRNNQLHLLIIRIQTIHSRTNHRLPATTLRLPLKPIQIRLPRRKRWQMTMGRQNACNQCVRKTLLKNQWCGAAPRNSFPIDGGEIEVG